MAISIFDVEENVVSRDLSGYVTYIYGPEKCGKTTFASKTEKPLVIACEIGYKAIPGIKAIPVQTWSEIKKIVRELKDPRATQMYHTIVFDTIDLAGGMCEKYVCQQADVETLTQIPYGQGWTKVKREFEDLINTVKYLGYAVMFISHSKDKTFKKEDGTEYNQIVQTCSSTFNDIAKNASDIIGYVDMKDGERKLVLRSLDNKVNAGCRFRDIESTIPFSYDSLVSAINKAIDSEAEDTGNKYITNKAAAKIEAPTYDFTALMEEFQEVVGRLMTVDQEKYAPKITSIVNKVVGKGKKVSDLNEGQAELLATVLDEINAL